MALPYAGPRQTLSSDDVHPAELCQRIVNRCNDSVDLLNEEHVVRGRKWGEHDVVTVPVATCLLKTPHYNATPLSQFQNDGQTYAWAKGFQVRPTWNAVVRGAGGYEFSVEFRLERGVEMLSARATARVDRAIGSVTSAHADALVPRFEDTGGSPSTGRVGTFYLGNASATQYLAGLIITVWGRRV
jgi:hypothetical protein